MADVKISDLTPLGADSADDDMYEIETAGGLSRMVTRIQIIGQALINAVAANTAKVSADGSVTSHNDVSDAGSGQIISNTERANITGSVTVHSDISNAGSGQIITASERNLLNSALQKLEDDLAPALGGDLDVKQRTIFSNYVSNGALIALDVVSVGNNQATRTGAVSGGLGPLGFAMTTVGNGNSVGVATDGYLGGFAGLTPDAPIFLGETDATITQDVSGFASGSIVRTLGHAITANLIKIDISSDWFTIA